MLAGDPNTVLHAHLNGYDYPFSVADALLANLLDVTVAAAPRRKGAPKPDPFPRPWGGGKKTQQIGGAGKPAPLAKRLLAAMKSGRI